MPVLDPQPEWFRRAVHSVLDQSLSDLELLVIEDPGKTGAAAVLDGIDDPRLHHRLNDRRAGMAAARNLGLELARAPLVAMCDADDVCAPERLAEQTAFLDRHPEVAVVGSNLAVIDAQGNPIGSRRYPSDHADIVRAMRLHNPIAHPTVMARTEVLREHGGYRDWGCEDYELWSRLARAGQRFANLAAPLLEYRVHGQATKRRRLHSTLRDTLRVKRTYWRDELDLRARLRMFGEQVLLWLPPGLVVALFRRLQYQRP
jgi:glycosyltransferase involved in cell wall biosynthesis